MEGQSKKKHMAGGGQTSRKEQIPLTFVSSDLFLSGRISKRVQRSVTDTRGGRRSLGQGRGVALLLLGGISFYGRREAKRRFFLFYLILSFFPVFLFCSSFSFLYIFLLAL